ncbi:ComF family protein [Bacillus sp. SM2101]|uniref:ComF family protein n=1 Tax=Bacillus sp. SM2101 TaxID=2805366 RepID=UPI001BDF6442|nr:ComF family protein [Bacillus sp. SM2101]
MKTCLLCHKPYQMEVSWHAILTLSPEQQKICHECHRRLTIIEGKLCSICGRPLQDVSSTTTLCYDCVRWENQREWRGVLQRNRSVYRYNDYMKEILNLFKFRGDYAVVYAFKSLFQQCFKEHFQDNYMIVPIPLSKQRLYERGFNQADAIAHLLDLSLSHPLSRKHEKKQSKKSRYARIHSDNMYIFNETVLVNHQQILLIDDVYTTGTTVRHAAKALLQAGAKSASSLTLVRG